MDSLFETRRQFMLNDLSPPVEVRLTEEDAWKFRQEIGELCLYPTDGPLYPYEFAGMKIRW